MHAPRHHRPRDLALASLVLLAISIAALAGAPSSAGADEPAGSAIFLPLAARQFAGPFATAEVAAPATTAPATVVPTSGATQTPSDTPTPSRTPTSGPTPTPTLPGAAVEYDTDPGKIVLQIGITDTDEQSAVWEEMNGTPWFTLYGDGRVIASKVLDPRNNLDQDLFVGRASDYAVQRWLRVLVHEVGIYQMADDYVHTRGSKPEVHLWLNTKAATRGKRVSLRGFFTFERRGAADYPDEAERIAAYVRLVRSLETAVNTGGDAPVGERFVPDCFTILAQKHPEKFLSDPPQWEGSVNVGAVAAAAPTAASNYVDKVVGHKFVDATMGLEIQAVVRPFALQYFPMYRRAAEFFVSSRPHGVGVRQEVPGGSMFLPQMPNPGGWAGGVDIRRSYWYRRDAGSGHCDSLPSRPLYAPTGEDAALAEILRAVERARAGEVRPDARLTTFLPVRTSDSPAR